MSQGNSGKELVVRRREGREAAKHETLHCPICLTTVPGHANWTAVLPCGHVFHEPCVRKWNQYDVHCPKCRSVVTGMKKIYPDLVGVSEELAGKKRQGDDTGRRKTNKKKAREGDANKQENLNLASTSWCTLGQELSRTKRRSLRSAPRRNLSDEYMRDLRSRLPPNLTPEDALNVILLIGDAYRRRESIGVGQGAFDDVLRVDESGSWHQNLQGGGIGKSAGSRGCILSSANVNGVWEDNGEDGLGRPAKIARGGCRTFGRQPVQSLLNSTQERHLALYEDSDEQEDGERRSKRVKGVPFPSALIKGGFRNSKPPVRTQQIFLRQNREKFEKKKFPDKSFGLECPRRSPRHNVLDTAGGVGSPKARSGSFESRRREASVKRVRKRVSGKDSGQVAVDELGDENKTSDSDESVQQLGLKRGTRGWLKRNYSPPSCL